MAISSIAPELLKVSNFQPFSQDNNYEYIWGLVTEFDFFHILS